MSRLLESPWLHVTNGKIDCRGTSLKVENLPSLDIDNFCGIVIYSPTTISAKAICLCARKSKPIIACDKYNILSTVFYCLGSEGAQRRLKQQLKLQNDEIRARISISIVKAKLQNSATVLRRIANRSQSYCIFENRISRLIEDLNEIQTKKLTIDEIRGYEGIASKWYFECFGEITKNYLHKDFHFHTRSRRPPKDKMNALLSFVYSLLLKEIILAIASHGLELGVGVLHASHPSRPSLALDLMEEFRSWVADRLVIRMIRKKIITAAHFEDSKAGIFLTNDGVKKVIVEYEKRMQRVVSLKNAESIAVKGLIFRQVNSFFLDIIEDNKNFSGAIIR